MSQLNEKFQLILLVPSVESCCRDGTTVNNSERFKIQTNFRLQDVVDKWWRHRGTAKKNVLPLKKSAKHRHEVMLKPKK